MTDKDRARAAHAAHVDNRNEIARAARLAAEQKAHEEEIRRLERERTHRNLLSMLVQPDPHEDPDFPGCVW